MAISPSLEDPAREGSIQPAGSRGHESSQWEEEAGEGTRGGSNGVNGTANGTN
jgi:hypothetical protein